MEADSAELSDVSKVICPITPHWESHSVLGISSESKLMSTRVHSINHSPLSRGCGSHSPETGTALSTPRSCVGGLQGLDTAVGGLQIKLQDKSRKGLVNFLITSETQCLGPCCSFSLKTPFFSSQTLLFCVPVASCPY